MEDIKIILSDCLVIILMLFATIMTGHEWLYEYLDYQNDDRDSEYVLINDIRGLNIEFIYGDRIYIQDSKYLFDYIGKKIRIKIDDDGYPVRADFPISIMFFLFTVSLLYTISAMGLAYEQIMVMQYKRNQKEHND